MTVTVKLIEQAAGQYGLGLGLAIARQIVELHRGTIKAESNGKGKEAGFIVQPPRKPAAKKLRIQRKEELNRLENLAGVKN